MYDKIQTESEAFINTSVYCNFIEIYNEEVFDLLVFDPKNAKYKKKYSLKKRKDFLKTSFGEILKTTHLNSEIKKGLWLSSRILLQYKKIQRINNKRVFLFG